jgi:glycosyltransferase involved in cell wall biosynthesis
MNGYLPNSLTLGVSVVTAVYNCRPYLRSTVESVTSQNLRPIEHILVNDASSDGSLQLAQDLAREFQGVRVVS